MRRALVLMAALGLGWGCRSAQPPASPAAVPAVAFEPHRLTVCSISEISGDRPKFVRLQPEGDVAWYGLILQGRAEPEIVNYLLSRERAGLWEYQSGYGPTAEDTALVVEGLLAAGATAAVERSLARLVAVFYRPEGHFVTVGEGRARYWRGPDVETNAHVGYLLLQGGAGRYAGQVSAVARYVAGAQEETGEWRTKWFPSRVLASYYALRFLSRLGTAYAEPVQRGMAWLKRAQQKDGSWGGSAIDTAAAVLALRATGYDGAAVRLGEAWLARWRADPLPAREPVLQYWVDGEHSRELYVCFETGEIARAWAALAGAPAH